MEARLARALPLARRRTEGTKGIGMDQDIWTFSQYVLVGFVLAALITSGFRAATGRPLGFALGAHGGSPLAVAAIVLRLIAGPAILVRNVVEDSTSGDRLHWLLLGLIAACAWSAGSGMLLIDAIEHFSGV